jgi:hypothetical protein
MSLLILLLRITGLACLDPEMELATNHTTMWEKFEDLSTLLFEASLDWRFGLPTRQYFDLGCLAGLPLVAITPSLR